MCVWVPLLSLLHVLEELNFAQPFLGFLPTRVWPAEILALLAYDVPTGFALDDHR